MIFRFFYLDFPLKQNILNTFWKCLNAFIGSVDLAPWLHMMKKIKPNPPISFCSSKVEHLFFHKRKRYKLKSWQKDCMGKMVYKLRTKT